MHKLTKFFIFGAIIISGLLLNGYGQNETRTIESIVCIGMPFQTEVRSFDKEGLDHYQLTFPKDPGNWKRYQFTDDYSLLLKLESEPVKVGSRLNQEVIDRINLIPNRIHKGKLSNVLTAYVVDLHDKIFR